MIRVAINGFGRIGRCVLRALYESGYRDMVQCVAINDLSAPATSAHLLQYDSVHGRFHESVYLDGDILHVGSDEIALISQADAIEFPWGMLDVDLVLECTGSFTTREQCEAHLRAGARKVLVSAPCDNADATVVFGVNDNILEAGHVIVSNASCTTNCLAPIAKVLHEQFAILEGTLTTIHSYTNDQQLLDLAHGKDLYRGRAAAVSLVPTHTGAATTIGLVLPGLEGRLSGLALRVPTPNVSLLDLTVQVSKGSSRAEVNEVMKTAADLMPVLDYCDKPLVSIDFNHTAASAIFDANHTEARGNLIKVLAWYDNEWGFSNRMLDTALSMMSA
jgi:glyceraldehyde 3-phosphate dehydrogenase